MAQRISGEHGHVPVMRDRMAELLAPAIEKAGENAIMIDGTLGAGGHTEYFLRTFPHVRIIGVDRDRAELTRTVERLRAIPDIADRIYPLHARFDHIGPQIVESELADTLRTHGLAGAFFDLGVSSMQLDQTNRGFTYREDGPLDMRMDPSQGRTAADILNTYDHGALARVLRTYGDERFASQIAAAIIREREKEPWSHAQRLVDLIYATIPARARRTGGHPAKRTFQALRIEVNGELDALSNVIPWVCNRMANGGRAVFMSYQSLEDKIVKKAFAELTTSHTPPGLPIDLPGTTPEFRLVTRGAEQATETEIAENSRAQSVRVRAIERIAGHPPPGSIHTAARTTSPSVQHTATPPRREQ